MILWNLLVEFRLASSTSDVRALLFIFRVMELEICCSNISSVRNAELARVKRIELCSELSVGGLTPSYGLVRESLNRGFQVHSLVRPRSGDFVYSNLDLAVILEDIEVMKKLGCSGVVVGCITADGYLDMDALSKIVKKAGDLELTFHRCFDFMVKPFEVLDQLVALRFSRILTSGFEANAILGFKNLCLLKDYSQNRITIMPGGGISSLNCMKFKEAKFDAIHLSAYRDNKPMISGCGHEQLQKAMGYHGESDLNEIIKVKRMIS